MKYCPKCRLVYPDSREQCSCGRILKHYEVLRGDTPVRVARTSGLEKDRITGALADAGIPYSETPVRERNMSEAVAGQGSVEWELCVPYEALAGQGSAVRYWRRRGGRTWGRGLPAAGKAGRDAFRQGEG